MSANDDTIIEDKTTGNLYLPAYTGFNRIMGKNSLVIPFRVIRVDGQWYELGAVDVHREAYPIKPIDIAAWMKNPPVLEDDDGPEEQEV
jgi:hypothetical protein